jgi:hypothetical protein
MLKRKGDKPLLKSIPRTIWPGWNYTAVSILLQFKPALGCLRANIP